MNLSPDQIELIVQRVVQSLVTARGAGSTPSPAAAQPASAQPATQPAAPAAPAGFRLSGAVITQELLAKSTGGARTVHIDARALLTPSARDYVRQHSLQIVRESAPTAASRPALRWQILVSRSTPQLAAAIDSLAALGIAAETRLLGVPAEAAAQAISAVCRAEAEQVVVFTDQPELVACLANRNDRIRAAAVADVASVERIRRQLQSNVLALNPGTKSVHELKTVLKAFRAA